MPNVWAQTFAADIAKGAAPLAHLLRAPADCQTGGRAGVWYRFAMRTRLASLLSCTSFALALTIVALPREALAGDIVGFGVGALGGVGVVGLGKPSDTTVTVGNVTGQDNTYPGFFGATAGAGVALDARLLGVVGVELDLFYAFSERAKGDLTVGPTTYNVSIGQPALHVPVLLKGVLPVGLFRPFVGFGPEFVLPGTSSAEVTPSAGLPTTIGARAESYTLLTAALGAEIKLPIPALDLRIPIALRASLNPGTSDKLSERRDVDLSGAAVRSVVYRSEFQVQGMLTAGISCWF
jgi:hypothetical protein